MKTAYVTRKQARKHGMPNNHTHGIISEGCMWYWGTGKSEYEAIEDSKSIGPAGIVLTPCLKGVWLEIAE